VENEKFLKNLQSQKSKDITKKLFDFPPKIAYTLTKERERKNGLRVTSRFKSLTVKTGVFEA